MHFFSCLPFMQCIPFVHLGSQIGGLTVRLGNLPGSVVKKLVRLNGKKRDARSARLCRIVCSTYHVPYANYENATWFCYISNLLFIIYGYMDVIYPVLVLHAILLPINIMRLFELRAVQGRLVRIINQKKRDYHGSDSLCSSSIPSRLHMCPLGTDSTCDPSTDARHEWNGSAI